MSLKRGIDQIEKNLFREQLELRLFDHKFSLRFDSRVSQGEKRHQETGVKGEFRVEWRWRVKQSRDTCRTHLGKTDGPQTLETGRGLFLSFSLRSWKLEREKHRGTDLSAVEHVHGPRPAATLILPRHPRAAGLQLRPPRSTSKLIGIQSGEANLQGPSSTLEGPAG